MLAQASSLDSSHCYYPVRIPRFTDLRRESAWGQQCQSKIRWVQIPRWRANMGYHRLNIRCILVWNELASFPRLPRLHLKRGWAILIADHIFSRCDQIMLIRAKTRQLSLASPRPTFALLLFSGHQKNPQPPVSGSSNIIRSNYMSPTGTLWNRSDRLMAR